jgi:hypothetical protein
MVNNMLDLMAVMAKERKLLRRDRLKPLSLDSTMLECRHVSRHYERRQKDTRGKKVSTKRRKTRISSEVEL